MDPKLLTGNSIKSNSDSIEKNRPKVRLHSMQADLLSVKGVGKKELNLSNDQVIVD